MHELVAIDMRASEDFVTALKKIWDSSDAVLPLDQRLPVATRRALAKQFNASSVVDNYGERTRISGGRPVQENDALVIATSGSTGEPKGVVHTHNSIRNAISITSNALHCTSSDHWFACISLAHVGGLSVVLRAMHAKSALTISGRADNDSIAQAIRNGATMTAVVPTILKSVDVSGFKAVLIGGAHAPTDLPKNVTTTYGLSETMGGIVYDGKPLDGVEIQISAESEIQLRSKSMLRCYRDETNPLTADNWLSTGDLGEITDGKLTVHGRRDDLINSGGFKVWPFTVEKAIREITNVEDVVVAGVPSEKWGSEVHAWIVLAEISSSLSLEDVRRFVKQTLPDYCAPRKIYLVSEIPRTALGKPKLSELRDLTSR